LNKDPMSGEMARAAAGRFWVKGIQLSLTCAMFGP
jgi:hypothetical protein